MYDLPTKEKLARRERDRGNLDLALALFREILQADPDYEHGVCDYEIACIQEQLGELASAEQSFRKAIRAEPMNAVYIGGLASFLYLHGDPQEALRWHLRVFSLEPKPQRARIMPAIEALGVRLGLTDSDLKKLLNAAESATGEGLFR